MPVLRKFRAIRPAKEFAQKIASLPYDVVSKTEAREIIKNNEHSFMRVVRSDADLPEGINSYANEVYTRAKENFQDFLSKNIL